MKNVFLLILSVLMHTISANAQTVRTIKDPAGNDIILDNMMIGIFLLRMGIHPSGSLTPDLERK